METTNYGGWKNCVRLANGEVELIVTRDVGPRIIRYGFIGERNVLGELDAQMGRSGESEWMIRGGHRLWIAPEEKPKTYELDNGPVKVEEIAGGVRTIQRVGPLSRVQKTMDITLSASGSAVTIEHTLTNRGRAAVELAPWALTVMAKRGTAVIPLPPHVGHSERLTHNQEWSLWSYTSLADPRWTIGERYLRFRQDPSRPANKLGIAHSEGWVAYLLDGFLFVKKFERREGEVYPDGNVNFETFANEDILELETLGPMVKLGRGKSVSHRETWALHKGVPPCGTEDEIERHVRPLIDA